ncbi:MAG: NUDIX domain-containing protein [Bacteroidaceae bacterium]|jgi:mutator protein MutT|nr:NUDIX domain-containing protein [Bacteroidaceae bacterium]MBQ5705752.1 NUDIX domain-containing protein [Bacteroidaceae bacterium]MBQ5816820.1 NUDIX domain-containing protein [Bacteroidaceae bacterium]
MSHPLDIFRHCPVCGKEGFAINNVKSKRCEGCGFVLYFNAISATVAVIMNEKDEILVARRAKEPAKGTLDLPGGFADSMETAEEAVTREVLEESGLRVTETKYLFSLPNKYLYSGFEEHTLDMFFLCRVESGDCPIANDDVEELAWMSLDDIRPELFGLQSIRRGIELLKEKKNEIKNKI